jgi:hypothetical protein
MDKERRWPSPVSPLEGEVAEGAHVVLVNSSFDWIRWEPDGEGERA